MAESDRHLLRGCRQGDSHSWERLLDQYERLVFSIPLNYGLSRDNAADIVQLTFTIFLQSLDKLDDDSNLGAWLATVARRHTWRFLERNRRESINDAEDLTESLALLGHTAPDNLARWELLEWLDNGLAQLKERCRHLLTALYFDAQSPSYAEIADRLGMSLGSIGPTRARCLERLREILDDT